MEDQAPIGVILREARMRQGLDLSECAAATRIRERYLIAIEDGRFESLPDPAYVSGFVRAYAAHLGVKVDGPERELPVSEVGTAPTRPRPVHVSATRITARGVGQRPRWRRRPVVILALIVAAAILAAVAAGVDLPFG